MALGLAAAAMGAHAQSGLVIYGIADVGVARMNDGASIAVFTGAGKQDALVEKTGWPNRLGFRGTEDLGGGNAAWFHLEHRFNLDDGTPATPWWQGRSVVGLSGRSWGEVALGRDYLPAFWQALTLDPWSWSTVGQMGSIYTWARYGGAEQLPRNNNVVAYKTPDFGGLTAQLSYSLSEGSATRGSAIGGNAIYSKGPLYLAFAFDKARNPTGGQDAALVSVGGSYDFGVVKPRLLYSRSKHFTNADASSLMLALTAPVGQGRILAGAAKLRVEGANNDATKFSVGYHYDLGRRTMLYVDLATAKQQGLSRTTGYDVGVRHTF
jgi:predicted porin